MRNIQDIPNEATSLVILRDPEEFHQEKIPFGTRYMGKDIRGLGYQDLDIGILGYRGFFSSQYPSSLISKSQSPNHLISAFNVVYFIILFSLFAISSVIMATSVSAVEVEPQRLELSLASGETSTTLIKVTNWLDYPVKINVTPDYYRHILTDNSQPPAGSNGKLPSCQDWLKFEPNEFQLSSRASIYVKCTIDVPGGIKKEHVASILFDEKGLVTTYEESPTKPGNITLELIPRFTIPVYITPKGNETISAKIINMQVLQGPALATIKTEITLHNTGTVHIRPSGNLAFIDSQGNMAKTIPIGECLPVFADYKEKIPVYYPQMLEPDNYTAICTINIGDGKLLQKKTHFTITKDYELE